VAQTDRELPSPVIGAVAAGVAPTPFLFIYATLFILRGTVVPATPPDITSTSGGEAIAGVVALAFLIFLVVGVYRFITQRGRWVFLLGQLICLGAAVDLLFFDSTAGRPQIPLVLAVTSAATVALVVLPVSWSWIADARAG
jgi:hypothetical protein